MADSDTIRRLWLLKSDLEESPDDEKLIVILRKLQKLPVSISALQETGIGKIVNSFRKRGGVAGAWVQKVVATWKTSVENEVKRQEEKESRDESSSESESSHVNRENNSECSDGENSSNGEEEDVQNHGREESDDDDDTPVRIKQERLSSGSSDGEESDQDTKQLPRREEKHRGRKDMEESRTKGSNEDDLTDSDMEADVKNESMESYIENYYHKILGDVEPGKEESKHESKHNSHHRSNERQSHKAPSRSEKTFSHSSSSISSTTQAKKDKNHHRTSSHSSSSISSSTHAIQDKNHHRLITNDHLSKKKRKYHSVSDSDAEEDVNNSRESSGNDKIPSHKRISSTQEKVEVYATSKSSLHHSDKGLKSEKRMSHSSHSLPSTPPCKSHTVISSSSTHIRSESEGHKGVPSISVKSHSHSASNHLSQNNQSKHSSASSPSEKHHKHMSSSSERHKSTSAEKHKPASAGEKYNPSSSSAVKRKHSTSSEKDKDLMSSSTSADTHKRSLSSSSAEKHKHSSSSSSSSAERHKRSSSSSADKHKHSSSSSPSAEKQKHSLSSSSAEKHKHSPYSSTAERHKHSSSSSPSIEKHKHSSSSSSKSQKISTSICGSGDSKNKRSSPTPLEYSPSQTKMVAIKKEKVVREEENEYTPSWNGDSAVEYIPSKKIKTESDSDDSDASGKKYDKYTEKNKYLEAVQRKDGGDCNTGRYSPTIGWKIKTEKMSEDYRYGGESHAQSETAVAYDPECTSSPLSYVPSRKIKQEKDEDASVDVPYVPTKKIKQEKTENIFVPSPDGYNDESDSETDQQEKSRYENHNKIQAAKRPGVESSLVKSSSQRDHSSDIKGKDSSSHRSQKSSHKSTSSSSHKSGSSATHKSGSSSTHKSVSSSSHKSVSSSSHKSGSSSTHKSVSPSSHKSHHHQSTSSEKEKKENDIDCTDKKHDRVSSSSSSLKHEKYSTSSSQNEKKSNLAHSHQKDKKVLKDVIDESSHSKKKESSSRSQHKEHSSHQSSSKSHSGHTSSDKLEGKTKAQSVSSSKASSSSTNGRSSTSTSTSSNRTSREKKKRKENIFADAGLDLFSDAIQIKTEPSSPSPHRRPRVDKHSSVKSRESSQASRISSPAAPSISQIRAEDKLVDSFDSEEDPLGYKSEEKNSSHPASGNEIDKPVDTDERKKKKSRKNSFHLEEEGMSFDDFLNFDESAVVKRIKTTSVKKSTKSAVNKTSKSSSGNPSSSRTSTSNGIGSLKSSLSLTVPAPHSNVSVTEDDILSMLPETQAFYRPLRQNPKYDEEESFEPADADVIASRSGSIRSKVYSGRKHVLKEMKSLYDNCLQVLMDNIDALDYVGGVPYSILKPVLERCTSTQLYQIEDVNPHFLDDSDELWESHCRRDFRSAEPEEMENWRELYLRKFEEREVKYQKLKANMSSVITKGQAGRHAKLAYVDTVAKPPRDVLRQQKRYGTGCVVRGSKGGKFTKDSAQSVKAYRPSVSVPMHNPMNDRPSSTYRATPPMLAKALMMRKNMRR